VHIADKLLAWAWGEANGLADPRGKFHDIFVGDDSLFGEREGEEGEEGRYAACEGRLEVKSRKSILPDCES
jgi:hypothetical protein